MQRTFSKFATIGAVFAAIVGITVLLTGQPTSKLGRKPASSHRIGVMDDWSHHHLVFSNPGTYEQAAKTSASYANWLTIRYDTRFILQQMKRHAETTGWFSGEMRIGDEEAVSPSGMVGSKDLTIALLRQLPGKGRGEPKPAPKPKPKPKPKFTPLERDWSQPMLTGTVQPNAYPVKWGTSLTSSNCIADFVVYPTGTEGPSSAASIVAYNNLYNSPSGCALMGPVPSLLWAFDTGATISTSPIMPEDGEQVAAIQSDGTHASLLLLKPISGVQATLIGGYYDITITSGTITEAYLHWRIIGGGVLPGTTIEGVNGSTVTMSTKAQNTVSGQYLIIVKPGTLGSPASPTNEASASYRNCSAPCMLILPFSGSGTVNDTFSAPFYDYASDDALYVGDDGGYLHKFTGVFNGAPSEATAPWPALLNASSSKPLTSPVYDPVSGNIFVGDTGGHLYAVGSGNAGTTSGSVTASAKLGDAIIDAPLVDSSAGRVYAFVTTNNDTTGLPTVPGYNAVFQFYTTTGTTPGTFFPGSSGNGTAIGTEVGAGGTGYYLYAGDFDNVYYQSPVHTGNLYVVGNTAGTTGATLYQIPITSNVMGSATALVTGLTAPPLSVSGSTTASSTTVTLDTSGSVPSWYVGAQISDAERAIPAGDTIIAVTGTTLTLETAATATFSNETLIITGSGGPPWPSPLIEFCNAGKDPCSSSGGTTTYGTDYLFFSVNGGTGCTAAPGHGCVLSYNITTPLSPKVSGGLDVTDVGSPGCWATGGLVIDNSDPYTQGASQVYFINLNGNVAGGAGGATSSACGAGTGTPTLQAVQASQSTLK